jgi:hypothetical protein
MSKIINTKIYRLRYTLLKFHSINVNLTIYCKNHNKILIFIMYLIDYQLLRYELRSYENTLQSGYRPNQTIMFFISIKFNLKINLNRL